jgi:hypothetical protein
LRLFINDLLGGRGWWLVKGALVRGPFLFFTALSGFFMPRKIKIPKKTGFN